jgi:hypothetical protein
MTQSATLPARDTACSKPTVHFELRFFLTEAEWREAGSLLHPVVGNGFNKPWVRLFVGSCAIFNLIFPILNGWSWGDLIRDRPQSAVVIVLGALFCGFLSTGVGMRFLNHRLNRLDLSVICLSASRA